MREKEYLFNLTKTLKNKECKRCANLILNCKNKEDILEILKKCQGFNLHLSKRVLENFDEVSFEYLLEKIVSEFVEFIFRLPPCKR